MRNEYVVHLINASGCNFDNASFSSIKSARYWASHRGQTFLFGKLHDYTVSIEKNGNAFMEYKTR